MRHTELVHQINGFQTDIQGEVCLVGDSIQTCGIFIKQLTI